MKLQDLVLFVIPAEAGIQALQYIEARMAGYLCKAAVFDATSNAH